VHDVVATEAVPPEASTVGLLAVDIEKVVVDEENPVCVKFEFNVTCPPAHAEVGVALGVKLAPSITPMFLVPLMDPHPVIVAENVYWVLTDGVAIVIRLEVELNPVEGLHAISTAVDHIGGKGY